MKHPSGLVDDLLVEVRDVNTDCGKQRVGRGASFPLDAVPGDDLAGGEDAADAESGAPAQRQGDSAGSCGSDRWAETLKSS